MTRSTLSKKMASSSRNRESPRILKRKEPPPSMAVRTKSPKQQKKITTLLITPLILRRSERTRNLSSSSPSQQQKPKQQESEDDDEVEAEAGPIKRKMNARIYKNMFKNPKRDCNSESNKMGKSTSEGGNNGGGKIEEGFDGNPVDCKEVSEDDKAEEVSKDVIIPSEDDKAEEVSKDGIIPSEDDNAEEVSKDGIIPSEDEKAKEVSKDGIIPSEDGKAEEVRAESRLSEPMEDQLENNVTLASWLPSNATTLETSGETERVRSDCREEDTSEMLESSNSRLNKSLIKNCVELDMGEKPISSKRKETMGEMHTDVSAMLVNDDNGNLIADASPSRNTVGTSESCSKRIRPNSLSDVQRNQTKLINNVDRPSSISEGEKLSTGNKEGKSGDSAERPQSSNDEVRKQQRSLHLLLKPGIAKLCEVLRLPDNVKRMVDNCLEYIMNNRQICTEPVSILQAFQLSVCWTAAALLKNKLDREDSFMLAKRHLNFDCKIEEVYEIHRMMRKLKKDFLYHTGKCNVSGSPKASESSSRVCFNTGVAPKVELARTDISRTIEVKQLLMQQEEAKKKLTADIEREKADFEIRCRIKLAAYLAFSRNDVMRTEKLKVFNSEYNKRIGELKRQHETQLKDLEAKQLEERLKFQESSPARESCNGCGLDTVTLVSFSSNLEICDAKTSDIPSGEVALAVHKSRCSNDQDEVSTSRQGKLDGTMLSKPVYDRSVDTRLYGSKNMVFLNSQSTEEHIPSATIISSLNCENAAQIHEANDGSVSNNVDTLSSPFYVERIASLNSKSPQEHVHSVKAKCMPNCENCAQIYVVGDDNVSNTAATVNSPLTDERIADGAISLLDKEVRAEMPGIVSFTDCPENVTSMNPLLSVEQLSGGVVKVSVSDRGLSRPCGTANPSNSNDANHITLSNQLSSEEEHVDAVPLSISAGQIHGEVPETSHEGVTVSVVDREAPMGMPGAVNCTDHPESVTPLNSSSTSIGQISDGGLSSRPSRASSPCDGPATVSLLNPPSIEHQIPDKDLFSIPDGQIPVMVPETNHEIDLNEPLEEMQRLSSVESPADQDTDREMLNSLLSSPVDIVPANQSNHVSLVMEPPEEVQQLSPSAEFLSSNRDLSNLLLVTGTEHQPSNEDVLSSPIPETSIEVPNQAVEQPASNLEHDSLMSGVVTTQSSDPRNFSTPSEINQHPIQSASQPASMIVPPLCDDTLVNEVERIRKLREQNMKNHEDMKLQLKSDFENEFAELRRKYEIKIKEMDVGFQQTRKKLDTDCKTVLLNKILAEAFRLCAEVRASGAPGVQQGASSAQQLCQLSRLQIATRPSLVSGPSSCAPPAASLLSSYTTTSSQNMVPPAIQASPHNTSGVFSRVSPRLPNINSISSPSGNPHAGGEMRAPAPHLQPYRPSTAVLAPSLSTIPHGMSSQPAPGNIPVTSTFSHWPATYQSDPYRGHRPVNLDVLPTTNLPAMDSRMGANSQSGINMQNVLQRISNMASLNQSRFGTSSSSMPANPAPHQATSSDVVCLSDDDD